MEEKLCFVQFLHPGGEHRPERAGLKGWNQGAHRRKFMLGRGRFLAGATVCSGSFVFWGEWEPPSLFVANFPDRQPTGPPFLFEPFFQRPASYRGLQNTDPFVFGKRFLYTGCLQHTKRGPTQLRYLSRGSVILFGSCVGARFVLDTVFVVADYIDHRADDFRRHLPRRVPDTYMQATIQPWYTNLEDRRRSHRLYLGASYDDPVEGMYSFVPCLPAGDGATRFPRPQVELPGVVTPVLKQGKRLKPSAEAGRGPQTVGRGAQPSPRAASRSWPPRRTPAKPSENQGNNGRCPEPTRGR